MKRFLTILCAIAFSGAALSAQNNADTIKVSRNESDTLVIIVKEKQSVDRQVRKEQRLAEKSQCSESKLELTKEQQVGLVEEQGRGETGRAGSLGRY